MIREQTFIVVNYIYDGYFGGLDLLLIYFLYLWTF